MHRIDHREAPSRKILWVGDAVAPTGFARCTHAVLPALSEAGWDVDVIGLSYGGIPHPYPYRIWPAAVGGEYPFGEMRLQERLRSEEYTAVVILSDPWNIPSYLRAMKFTREDFEAPPVIAWLAVDAKNQRGEDLNDLAHVVTLTAFAAQELRRGGYEGPSSIVPLGVDHSIYYPRDRAEARSKVAPSLPPDAFIVGCVGRNQPRKRLDLTLSYFADWLAESKAEDAYLFLHSLPVRNGTDVISLVRYYGLRGRVLLTVADGSGVALSEDAMALIYSALDVYLTTTQGEGWGLPVLEAMACGVPCIVPDWSGLGEWATAAARVPCFSTAISAPLNDLAYTVGGVPDRAETIRELDCLYRDPEAREMRRSASIALAARYSWTETGRQFVREIESVLAAAEESTEAARG